MQQDAQTKAQLAQYNDELARKRAEAEHEKQRQRNMEMVRFQEESARRQEEQKAAVAAQIEAERRATEKYRADMEKTSKERERWQRQKGERKKGEPMRIFIGESCKAFEKWFGTPKLVRETSRKPLIGKGSVSVGKSLGEVKKDFGDIVLQPKLQDHVRALAAVTSNTKRHGAPFRHMLFYGPPGTGKTMAAKRLARTSGLDYAILSGGDVAPLQGGAVTQLHETFDWAEKSRKGLLLFIDEADAFLGRRSGNMSEGLRGALNAMLFRTGDQSKDFCVVLATNRPSDLDPAVIDRMDEALEFGLPSLEERKKIIDIYFDKYITHATAGPAVSFSERVKNFILRRKSKADEIRVNGVTEQMLWDAAEKTSVFLGENWRNSWHQYKLQCMVRMSLCSPHLYLRMSWR
eukprot:jgi/Picre1/30202/NNA_005571.t1